MRRPYISILLLALVLILTPLGHQAEGAPGKGGFTDPFLYCAAVGTVDKPDARWAGPKVPESIVEGLMAAAGVPPTTPSDVMIRGTFWRCMDGHVYACFVGANLPCEAKADTRRAPSPAMWAYCDKNPGVENIPAYVTGRETVYQWRCTKDRPTVVRQVAKPDARGFIKHIWYKIAPAQGKQ